MAEWIDNMHLVKVGTAWKIINILYEPNRDMEGVGRRQPLRTKQSAFRSPLDDPFSSLKLESA